MPATESTGSPLRGVMLVMAAVLVFACMDAATKHMATRYNVPLVVALRYGVNLLLLVAIMAPRHGWAVMSTQRTGLVVLRAASLALASLFAGLALQRMPVAETVAIIYLAPFGVLILAGPLLGERVGWQGWLAAAAGFCGVLLVGRPGSGLAPMGILFAAIAAAVSVAYVLLSRMLATTETTLAMLFYAAVAGSVFFGAMLPWYLTGPSPEPLDIALFAGIGAISLLGHTLFTAAYREAPASLLAPVNYMHIAWAGGLGWLVFGHLPDGLSLIGMALVALSGSAVALWTHRSRQATNQAALVETPSEI